MNQMFSIPMADCPLAALTVGQFREVIRQELSPVLNKNIDGPNGLTRRNTLNVEPYLTVTEAADLARVAVSTIRLYIRRGRLKAQKVGRRVIVNRAELEKFLDAESTRAVDSLGLLTN